MITPTQRLLEDFEEASRKLAMARHAFEVARERLRLGPDGIPAGHRVHTYITHKDAAKDAKVTTKTVIRWITGGELKAAPKAEGSRVYQIPLDEWEKFKARR